MTEIEMDEVATHATALSAQIIQHIANPPRPFYQRVSIERDRAVTNEWLMKDYFDANPRYAVSQFKRRFRMSSRLYLRITQDLE